MKKEGGDVEDGAAGVMGGQGERERWRRREREIKRVSNPAER